MQLTRPQSEMATVGELVQMMHTLQGQHYALNQEISRSTAENQQFRQAGSPGLAEIATTVGQAVQTAISNATHDQLNDKVWSTSKALGNFQCSKENLRSLLNGSGRLMAGVSNQ